MTNSTLPPNTANIRKHNHFGMRLKSAREALGIDIKEVAMQLRLHEQMITMMESGEFKSDIPLTFIRGYIRNYSKLMDIPEKELHEALETLKPKPKPSENSEAAANSQTPVNVSDSAATMKQYLPSNTNNFFMQLFSYLLAITLIALVGIWWHTHKTKSHPNNTLSATQIITQPSPAPASTPNEQPINPAATAPVMNAENPDSLPPSNTEETATAQAPAPQTQTAPAPVTKKPAPQETSYLNEILFNPYTLSLISLGLLAVFILVGLRFRSNGSLITKISQDMGLSRVFKRTNKFNKIAAAVGVAIAVGAAIAAGVSGIWWHKSSPIVPSQVKKPPVAVAPQKVPVVEQTQAPDQQIDESQIYADIETLAPSANFNSALMASLKLYPLQEMAYQLDSYIAQAAAVNFALTDPSTDLGQLKPIKKKRRYHRVYRRTQPSSVPPYYQHTGGLFD